MRLIKTSMLSFFLCLAACNGSEEAKPSENPSNKSAVNKEFTVTSEISGRWASDVGVIKSVPDLFVVVDITSAGEISFELRKPGRTLPTIVENASGEFEALDNFERFSGSLSDASGDLAFMEEFSFMRPQEGKIRFIGNGGSFDARYKGE